MNWKLTQDTVDQEQFRQLAASGLSDRKIAATIGCSVTTVGRWRDLFGIPRSKIAGRGAVQAIDGHFLAQIDTPEKAYILGFLIADGHVYGSGNRVELGVKEADSAILTAITDAMGISVPLRVALNSYDKSRFIRVALGGRMMTEDLAAYGLRNDKSKTAVYPSVPPELESHLVRGIWDGDGWIGKYQFELIGTPALLDGVVAVAERNTGCLMRRRMSGKENRYHYAYGTRRDADILRWMYSSASIALTRKREKFLTDWSEVPSTKSLNHRIGARVYTRKPGALGC
jgi:hypothetical protein